MCAEGANPIFPSLIARRHHPTCTQSVSQTSGGLTVSKVKSLYILHEADISKFIDAADSMIAATMNAQPTRLKTICNARGFTQQELSEVSGVPLRMIQLYEQRRNNISEASAVSVISLANALGCQPIDLMEHRYSLCISK